ncbi:unnamed protein product, partial [Dovyalis caffra]
MDYGEWTREQRVRYNKWDGNAYSTIQVVAGSTRLCDRNGRWGSRVGIKEKMIE